MVASARGTHQAWQANDRQIEPPEALAVGGVAELVHTKLVAEDETLVFTAHRVPQPQVDKGAQRHAAAKRTCPARGKGDAAKNIHPIDPSRQGTEQGEEPSHKGLWQLPSEP